jgi:hypothetical protein
MKRLRYNGIEVELLTEIEEMDEDVTKLGHYLVCKATKKRLHQIDWSPYNDMTIEDVSLYIQLGCPKRMGNTPLDSQDLKTIEQTQNLLNQINKATEENTFEIE